LLANNASYSFYDPFKTSYHLEILCTIAQHRRKGAATALIKWAIDRAGKDGAVVGTEPSDEAAEFYRNRGFVKVGQLAVRNPAEPDIVLEVPVVRYSPSGEASGRADWRTKGEI
jgi:GNAT superfamily N-acetyltransferase